MVPNVSNTDLYQETALRIETSEVAGDYNKLLCILSCSGTKLEMSSTRDGTPIDVRQMRLRYAPSGHKWPRPLTTYLRRQLPK
jgi:hypothetical protein